LLSLTVLLLDRDFRPRLVVVLVAQGCASSIEDVPDADGGAEVVHIDGGVQGKRVACLVGAVNSLGTRSGLVLPDAEVAVDEAMVQPEDGVSRRAVGVLHDSTDTIVSPSVRRTLGATGHAGIIVLVVATVDELGAGVDGLGVVIVTGKAMEVVVCAGTNVNCQVGELLYLVNYGSGKGDQSAYAVGDAVSTSVDSTKPLVGEDGRRGKLSSVLGLVPPW
jgi:hypothetical protein